MGAWLAAGVTLFEVAVAEPEEGSSFLPGLVFVGSVERSVEEDAAGRLFRWPNRV